LARAQINHLFRNAKAITRRELYNGIFADQDLVYGDELPNIILIVLIGVGKMFWLTLCLTLRWENWLLTLMHWGMR
jgi:hypothetical protein